jgi:hypothetical protein
MPHTPRVLNLFDLGGEDRRLQARLSMTHDAFPLPDDDALDELVAQLLGCGAVLGQLIGRMLEFEAAGRSARSAHPIPEVAHSVVRSVIPELTRRRPARELEAAAAIVSEVTDAICEEILLLPLDPPEASGVDYDAGHAGE